MNKNGLAITFLFLFTHFCSGQVKTALHSANIGKIFFTDKRIATEALTKNDFLKSYKLTNKSNLFFVAYFDSTLSQYKQQILPGIAPDALFKIGNYQFSLYIDNKLIYQSNLLPGAPPAKSQHSDTQLNRPFIDNINGQGSWSESFWNRFLRNGGDQVLTDGKHLLKMEIRPYVKTDSIITGAIIATGELKLVVARHPKINTKKISLNKISPYNGLTVSGADFDKRKIKALKGAIDAGIFKKINSVIVLKDGQILIEEYFNGAARDSLHDPRSVGKSFASTLSGIAIRDGFIKSDTQTISDFYNLQQYQNFNSMVREEFCTLPLGYAMLKKKKRVCLGYHT